MHNQTLGALLVSEKQDSAEDMYRRRRGRRGRLPVQPNVGTPPMARRMNPQPQGDGAPIYLDLAEADVLRLVDLEDLYQQQAAVSLGISRGTVWRLLENARKKVIRAIFEGRSLIIGSPGRENEK